jgi:hypothetical protein
MIFVGAGELVSDLIGHPISRTESQMIGGLGFCAIVLWFLDNILERLERILEELKRK